jgi:hypothetical protein
VDPDVVRLHRADGAFPAFAAASRNPARANVCLKNSIAANRNVAAIHEELARLYEARVEQEERRSSLQHRETRLHVRLGAQLLA